MAKTGRNEPCPCGSGKKFKKCCETKRPSARVNKLMIAGLLVALAGGVYVLTVGFSDDGTSIAAPGRVWSPEHGHYH
jgi:hypothetical protein